MAKASDELQLWESFPNALAKFPRDAGHILNIPAKRVVYLCAKWAKKGVYEYGTSVDLGWKTNEKRN